MLRISLIISVLVISLLSNIGKISIPNSIDEQISTPPQRDSLDEWIDKLEGKELDGRFDRDHCIVDNNGKLSCGCLQYQEETFKEVTNLPEIKDVLFKNKTEKEIMSLYKDCDTQKKVTKLLLLNHYEQWRRWKLTVTTKIGYPPTQ